MKNVGLKQVIIVVEEKNQKYPMDVDTDYTFTYAMLVSGNFDRFIETDDDIYCCNICGSTSKKCKCIEADRLQISPDELLDIINDKLRKNKKEKYEENMCSITMFVDDDIEIIYDVVMEPLEETKDGEISRSSFYELLGLEK